MKVDVVTLFPEIFSGIFTESILQRAVKSEHLTVNLHNLRDYTNDKHHQADDYRFGGGPGMLLKPEPFFRVLREIFKNAEKRPLVIFPSPQGELFSQESANELSQEEHLVFLCGHYKGVDQRVIERWVDREYSLGDYVITGGELATAVMVDAAVRLIPGVLGDLDSALTDSFQDGYLDSFHYTRPEIINDNRVPGVVLSGHHVNIDIWRREMAKLITRQRRPDMIAIKQDKEQWKTGKNSPHGIS